MEGYNQENVFDKKSVVECGERHSGMIHSKIDTCTNTLTRQKIISQDYNLNEDLCFTFKPLLKISFLHSIIYFDIVKRECVFLKTNPI